MTQNVSAQDAPTASETSPVSWQAQDDVLLITIDNPPVNALGHAVRVGLIAAIDVLEADGSVVGAVLTGGGRAFVAGADITEFGKPIAEPGLNEVIDRIEGASKPVVAAINGFALGGGLELTLGCHARIAHPKARVGFPEVHLGVIPGAGGTQRMPRLAGVEIAVELSTTGKPISAARALSAGIVEAVDEDCVAAAVARARELAAAGEWTRVGELPSPSV
ncbi:MAG: enoyl-CoA hydratase/isomerase family protein, partial [Pseudomonadota bacterium]|nr:enoyl-CoA hydratase/isomerase family protein [Pseudomonadota bacterium]